MTGISAEYLSLTELSKYCSVGKKTLNKWINRGMPVYRIGRLVRVKKSEFDNWMKQFRSGTSKDLNSVWDQVMKEVQ